MILLLIPAVLLAWVAFSAPLEWACRRSPAFEAKVARFIEWVL